MPPDFFFFLKIALAIQGLLQFHINLRVVCSISVKNTFKILIGITLNLYIALDSMDILATSFQSTSMEYLFIYLCLQFLWSMSYRFQYTGLLPLA